MSNMEEEMPALDSVGEGDELVGEEVEEEFDMNPEDFDEEEEDE